MSASSLDALVVGESTLLGRSLLHALERQGWRTQGSFLLSGTLGQADRPDPQGLCRLVQDLKPRAIFLTESLRPLHIAEIPLTEGGVGDREATALVAEVVRQYEGRVVFYSSDDVFDGSAGPYSEEEEPTPTTPLGQVLLTCERAVRELCPKNHVIIRTSMLFGWDRGSRNLAREVWERLQVGNVMCLANDHWGNPTYADYLAEVSLRLAQMGVHGIVHVAGKDWMTQAELAQVVAKAMGLDSELIVPVPSRELGSEEAGPVHRGLKTRQLEQLLGTEPLNLQESLKRFRRQWRTDTHITYNASPVSDEAGKLKQEILDKAKQYYALVHTPKEFIPFKSRVQYSGRVFGPEEIVNLVDSALDFWLTLGPYGELFERKMRRFFGSRDFLVVNSGSTANLLAVLTLMSRQLPRPLRPGDEVITTPVAFPTTIAPLVHSGLVPVFVDSEVGTYNINPRLIEGAISPKTRAIMISHTLGNPCDMDLIGDLATRYELYLIEDCCDALGATFHGQLVGTFGELATLSFYPAHQITMGEGGGLVVNRIGLSRIARSVRDWGRDCWCAPGESNTCGKRFGWQLGALPQGYDHKYTYSNIGYNFKPTDLQAAIGVAQADRIGQFVEARRRNFQCLYDGLVPYQDHLILPTLDSRSKPSWFGFPITVKHGVSRAQLVQRLENANIETREIFGGNILRQPGYQDIPARIHGTLEGADRIMRDTFFVGIYPGLTDAMIDFMLEVIRSFFDGSSLRS